MEKSESIQWKKKRIKSIGIKESETIYKHLYPNRRVLVNH
jgi:hypothetical protein